MRYKPEHKEETHRRIVETAAREFRSRGFEGVGVATLMEASGLTHGGFYAHFADKEALVAEASVEALDQMLHKLLAAREAGGLPAVIDFYLGEGHRDHPELGCPLPALASEVARHTPAVREAFTRKLSEFFDALAAQVSGPTAERRRARTYALFATLAGAVSLARAVSDPALSRAILDSTREDLLRRARKEAD